MRISDWSSDVCSSDLIIAVAVAAVASALVGLPVETIGTRFGGIPQTLPMPHLPEVSYAKVIEVLPNALSFTLLGCIESLLSAVVADSMTGRRHRSNCELVAQGIANIASRSEEHTSELQSLLRISYAVFCLKKTNNT